MRFVIASLSLPAVALAQPFPIVRIADTSTLVPGTSTHFKLFNYPSAGQGVVGFSGTSSTILNPGFRRVPTAVLAARCR